MNWNFVIGSLSKLHKRPVNLWKHFFPLRVPRSHFPPDRVTRQLRKSGKTRRKKLPNLKQLKECTVRIALFCFLISAVKKRRWKQVGVGERVGWGPGSKNGNNSFKKNHHKYPLTDNGTNTERTSEEKVQKISIGSGAGKKRRWPLFSCRSTDCLPFVVITHTHTTT